MRVVRGCKYSCINYHNSDWLLHKRSEWVVSNGSNSSRNSVWAGRTGTILSIGWPQPRWEEVVALVRSVLPSRDAALRGNRPLGIVSRIKNAMSTLPEFFSGQHNVAS